MTDVVDQSSTKGDCPLVTRHIKSLEIPSIAKENYD